MKTKKCTGCQIVKPLIEFYRQGKYYRGRCKPCWAEYNKPYADAHEATRPSGWERAPEGRKKYSRRSKLLSDEEYAEKLKAQDNRCMICGEEETDQREGVTIQLSADHCHTTGKARDLLCRSCNLALGKFKDNPEIVLNAYHYLKRHCEEC